MITLKSFKLINDIVMGDGRCDPASGAHGRICYLNRRKRLPKDTSHGTPGDSIRTMAVKSFRHMLIIHALARGTIDNPHPVLKTVVIACGVY